MHVGHDNDLNLYLLLLCILDLISYISGWLGWKGYGDMNRQQEIRSTSSRLQIYRQRMNWRLSLNKQYLVIGAIFLSLIGLAVPLLVSAPWHKTALAPPRLDQRVHSNDAALQAQQQATSTPSTTPTLPPALINAQINALLNQQVAHHQFSGSVLIAKGGEVLLSSGYGMADLNQQVPNTPDTRFYLGSVTKQFTAMAILMLQQQGKLDINDKLCAHLPECPAPWQLVTLHEVLTHTSGIPQLDDSQLSATSLDDWINSFDNYPLEFPPGSQEDYCNVCYQVLAFVVEKVSGEPYSQFIQQEILGPLNMKESGFDSAAYYSQPNHSIGYESWQVVADQLGWEHIDPQWSFLFGSGLLYSTVSDLYLWDQALYTNTLISRQTLETAFTPYITSNLFPTSKYGYGWFITRSPVPGHPLIWHDGVIKGFRNYIGRYIDDHVTIIILSNLSTVDVLSLAHSIEQIVFAKPAISPGGKVG